MVIRQIWNKQDNSSQTNLRPPKPTLFPYTTLFRSAEKLAMRRHSPLSTSMHGPAKRSRSPSLDVREAPAVLPDRKSTRLNSSHVAISYAVFCLKKKTNSHKAMRSPAHRDISQPNHA